MADVWKWLCTLPGNTATIISHRWKMDRCWICWSTLNDRADGPGYVYSMIRCCTFYCGNSNFRQYSSLASIPLVIPHGGDDKRFNYNLCIINILSSVSSVHLSLKGIVSALRSTKYNIIIPSGIWRLRLRKDEQFQLIVNNVQDLFTSETKCRSNCHEHRRFRSLKLHWKGWRKQPARS